MKSIQNKEKLLTLTLILLFSILTITTVNVSAGDHRNDNLTGLTKYEQYLGANTLNGDTVNPGANTTYQSFTIGTNGPNETFTVKGLQIGVAGSGTNATLVMTIYNASNQTTCLFNVIVANGTTANMVFPSGSQDITQNLTLENNGTLNAGKTYCIKMYNTGPTGVVWTVDRAGTYEGGLSHSNDYGNIWKSDIDNWFGIYGDIPGTDSTYPTFSNNQSSPPNNPVYSLATPYQFNITITDTNGTAGIEFNGTNYTILNITSNVYNKTFTDLGAGTYSYYYWAYGNGINNLYNTSSVYSYTIIKANGLVRAYINDTNNNFNSPDGLNVKLNGTLITLSGTGNNEINLTLNGIEINRGQSPLNNITNLSYGYYNFSANYDGNENYTSDTELWVINVTDTIPPNIILIYPPDNSYLNYTNINFTWNVTDINAALNTTIYVYNNTDSLINFTSPIISNPIGVSITFIDGIYHWYITAYDVVNNFAYTNNQSLIIDTTVPIINYTQPPTLVSGNYSIDSLWINVTAQDVWLANITLMINGSGYNDTKTLNNINAPSASYFYNWTGLSEGFYNISAYVNDYTNHAANISVLYYSIDNQPPVISYDAPTLSSGATSANNNFIVNVSGTDINWANMTLVIYDSASTIIYTNFTTNKRIDIQTQNLSDGTYSYTTTAYDTIGNKANLTRNITLGFYQININSCRALNVPNANYVITQDLATANGTCLDVLVTGAKIDCNNHVVIGNASIRITKTGATLSNCVVIAYNSNSIALKVQGNSPASIIVYNSTFSGGLYGIYVAPEASLKGNGINVLNNVYGVYLNNSVDGSSITSSTFSSNSEDTLTMINTSTNTFSNINILSAGDTSNDGVIRLVNTSNNMFISSTFTTVAGDLLDLNDYSINNIFQSCTYTSGEFVDGTSELTRRWYFTGQVVDKAMNEMQNAIITFVATVPIVPYGTLQGSMSTNSPGYAAANVTQYMNIYGTTWPASPYVFTASFAPFTPTVATLAVTSDMSHVFQLDQEIASNSMTRTAMWLILGIIFLIGLAAGVGFFMVRMREGYSVVDIWKYFMILVIWLTIFTILFWVLAWFIMGSYYPQIQTI